MSNTANTPQPIETVFLWLGRPTEGPEHLLMMLTDAAPGDAEKVYRPLMAVNAADAAHLRTTAQLAADALGCDAVLREYRVDRSPLGLPLIADAITPSS